MIAFLVNVIPAFMPPTWIVLSMYKVHNRQLDSFWLAIFGVIGSVGGRFVLYFYCKALGKCVPQRYTENLTYLGRFLGKKKLGFFAGTFIYSLSPLPFNFLFIASGVTAIEILPIMAGFALGRLISYASLIYASYTIFSIFDFLGIGNIRQTVDILGILGAVSIVFVDWKRILRRRNVPTTRH